MGLVVIFPSRWARMHKELSSSGDALLRSKWHFTAFCDAQLKLLLFSRIKPYGLDPFPPHYGSFMNDVTLFWRLLDTPPPSSKLTQTCKARYVFFTTLAPNSVTPFMNDPLDLLIPFLRIYSAQEVRHVSVSLLSRSRNYFKVNERLILLWFLINKHFAST